MIPLEVATSDSISTFIDYVLTTGRIAGRGEGVEGRN
jgi:hypothetical protein